MATLETEIGSNIAPYETAIGRFFDPETKLTERARSDINSISRSVLVQTHHLLHDSRGLLLQFGIAGANKIIDYLEMEHPYGDIAVTLEFDGSGGAASEFAWQLTLANMTEGRMRYKLFSNMDETEVYASRFRANGSLVYEDVKVEEPSEIIDAFKELAVSKFLAYRIEANNNKKDNAIEQLGQFTLKLIQEGRLPAYIRKQLDRRQKSVDAAGFGKTPPITKPQPVEAMQTDETLVLPRPEI